MFVIFSKSWFLKLPDRGMESCETLKAMPKKEILVFGVCKLSTKCKNLCILQFSMLLGIEANVTFAINHEFLWKPNNMHLNLGTVI